MTDNQTLQTDTCPNCQHQQHAPDVECEGLVNHNGDRHWHRCLCLKRAGADSSCHPLMTCQGGNLGYSDIWHLQRGHTLQGADGPVTPDVLTAVPVSSPPPDQTALRDRIAATMARADGWEWAAANFSELSTPATDRYRRCADAVLAVLPPPADRAAVLLWAADQIDAETRQAKADGVLEPDKYRPCRDASAQLRALAGCQECASGLEHDVHCPTPETHNWGCGCPTDPVPADGPSRLAAEAQQPDTETRSERPRCPHCQLPHDLDLASGVPAVCASIRANLTTAPPVHKGGNADDCPACQTDGLDTIGPPYECPGTERP